KPFATSYAEGREALEAARRAGVLNAIGFNYRRLPAVSLMKRMIDEGAIGRLQLLRGCWLSAEFVDPPIPFDWRFARRVARTTTADVGRHLIDMAIWMVGDIAEVSAQSATFVAERADPEKPGAARSVTIDDASSALMRFAAGARGVLEMARSCVRRPCDFTVE